LRQETVKTEDSPISNSSSFGTNIPSSSYRGSSREDSISSSFFGDTDSRADDVPVVISKHSTDEWPDRDFLQAFDGLGILDGPLYEADTKVVPSTLPQSPAPTALEDAIPRKKPSSERIGSKRRSIEKKRRDSAESGDDEDEELGHVQIRARSPKTGRARGSSKLGTEMLRTNSRGSVISVEDISTAIDVLPSSPPPMISEERFAEDTPKFSNDGKSVSLTPPEIFPRLPGALFQDIKMSPAKVTTPKQPYLSESPDPDPTPRPSISGEKGPSPATTSPSPSR